MAAAGGGGGGAGGVDGMTDSALRRERRAKVARLRRDLDPTVGAGADRTSAPSVRQVGRHADSVRERGSQIGGWGRHQHPTKHLESIYKESITPLRVTTRRTISKLLIVRRFHMFHWVSAPLFATLKKRTFV